MTKEIISELAEEVLAYLNSRPDAQDTLEGITRWWLLERWVERELGAVEEALRQLVAAGHLEIKESAVQSPRYALNQNRSDQASEMGGLVKDRAGEGEQ